MGARWEEKAHKAEAGDRRDEAKQAYLKSYGYYGIGRHPFPSTPGKQHAYLKAREMHLAASRYFDIPLERVAIPFHGKEIVGHLRLPEKTPAPLVMHWGGIDNWKEERHTFAERFVKEGWSCLVLDSPGTGECPMLASPDAHQVHAGINPSKSLAKQTDSDLLWIRDEFIHNPHRLPYTVLFGHTPRNSVLFDLPYKIGLDTGLVYGNKLSCLEIVERVLFQIGRGQKDVKCTSAADQWN